MKRAFVQNRDGLAVLRGHPVTWESDDLGIHDVGPYGSPVGGTRGPSPWEWIATSRPGPATPATAMTPPTGVAGVASVGVELD
jgi:hypothetical protein